MAEQEQLSYPYSKIREYAGLWDSSWGPEQNAEYNRRSAQDDQEMELIKNLLTEEDAARMACIARDCLGTGDLQRGIQAIALAVAVDSGRAEWRQLLDRYMDHVERDEATLLPCRAF